MEPGESRPVPGTDVHLIETGMYDVAGYGCVYLLDAERPVLVESGIGRHTDAILEAVADIGVDPEALAAVAVTHVHLDHAGGAGAILEACPNATLYVHETGARHLVDPDALVEGTKAAVGDAWDYYGEPVPADPDRVRALTDGDAIDLSGDGDGDPDGDADTDAGGSRELVAHHCPGHAPHQVVFADTGPGGDGGSAGDDPATGVRSVFTGDAAGIWVADREQVRETTPPPQFDLEQSLADVETVRALGPERLLFTHFGPGPADVDDVLNRYRHRLVGWVEAVRRERERLGDDAAVADHFAEEAAGSVADAWGERKARQEARLNVRGVLAYLDGRD